MALMKQYEILIRKLFDFIDDNRDLEISWNEFLAFQCQAQKLLKAKIPFKIQEIRNEFTHMDADGSGTISRDEFIKVMTEQYDKDICAPLEEFLKQIEPVKMTNDGKDKFVQQMMLDFDKADLDKDGTINFSEFVRKIWSDLEENQDNSKLPTLKQLRRQFKLQDQNGDGKISRQEFQLMAENCYEEAMNSQNN